MNRTRPLWRWIAVALWLVAGAAQAATGEEMFQTGLRAFRSGDYLLALSHFQQARRAGYDSPTLDYNIGVSHYKLGDYPQARTALERAARNPELRGIAAYNLGLTALRLDEPKVALQWFKEAQAAAPDDTLRKLAGEQIARLESGRGPPRDWMANLAVNIGYDDNIVDPVTESGQVLEDSLVELLALVSGPVAGTLRNGVRLDASLYAVRYSEYRDYDLGVLRFGVAGLRAFGAWQGELAGHYEPSTLGGDEYLNTGLLTVAAARRWADNARLRLRYRYARIDARDPLYEELSGWRQQFDVQNRWGGDSRNLVINLLLETNDRTDYWAGNTFTSYSPNRVQLRIGGETELAGRWIGGAELGGRISRYADPNRLSDGRRVTRQDEQLLLRLRARRPLAHGWEVVVEYGHTFNESNIDLYDYRRNLYLLGINGLW